MTEVHKTIGDKLKIRRESLNLSLEDVSEETKISVEYLQSIESGQIDSFPSVVYYDMFARSYAKEMEMNPDELFEELKTKAESVINLDVGKDAPQPAPPPAIEKKNNGFSFVKLAAWLGGIIILIFIAVVVWSIMGNKFTGSSPVRTDQNTATAEPETPAPLPGEPLVDNATGQSEEPDLDLPEYEPVKPMILQVTTRDSCWVMVLADGDTVLNRNLPGGAVRELSAAYRFLVSAGNPSVLDISLDGQLLKPLSESGRPYRDREINQLNKKNYLAVPEDSDLVSP